MDWPGYHGSEYEWIESGSSNTWSLYFVHSDAFPPKTYIKDIEKAVAQGFEIGCFRFQFDSPSLMLKLNSYFTRFNKLWCRGGDQTLFVTNAFFDELGGYDNSHMIMEEYDFIKRSKKQAKFKIIPKDVIVSARKYDRNSYLKVSFANIIIFTMFYLGFSARRMKNFYLSIIKWYR